MGSHPDVVVHASVLEEELSVSPEGAELVGAGHDPADELLLTTLLRRRVECEDLEQHRVHWDHLELITEVVLELVSPAVDIVGLKLQLEGPVGLMLLVAVLVEHADLHD